MGLWVVAAAGGGGAEGAFAGGRFGDWIARTGIEGSDAEEAGGVLLACGEWCEGGFGAEGAAQPC